MTNFITITNYVFANLTNPGPVVFAGLDYQSALLIYLNAFAAGAPWACTIGALFMIARSLKASVFPSSED